MATDMTLADLYPTLDWSTFEEDISDQSKQGLLDCALYMRACASDTCNWKGVREDSGMEYSACAYCGGPLVDDHEAREQFRKRLGNVWIQVLGWLKAQGLVVNGVDK